MNGIGIIDLAVVVEAIIIMVEEEECLDGWLVRLEEEEEQDNKVEA
jgi:hypothetical protein